MDEGGGQTVSLENTTRKKEKTKTLQLLSLSLSKFSLLQARPFPSLLSLLGGKRQVAEHVLLCADRGEREELLHCLRGRPLGSVAVAVICFFFKFCDFFHFRRGELSDFSPCFPQRFKSFSPSTAAIGFAQRAIERKDPRAEGKNRDSDESERGGEGSKKEKLKKRKNQKKERLTGRRPRPSSRGWGTRASASRGPGPKCRGSLPS